MFQAFTARNDSLSLNSDYVNHLLTDRQGTLWLTNECGIAAWNGYGFKKPEQSTYTPIIGIYDLTTPPYSPSRCSLWNSSPKKT